jgi:glycosyltransferase involved in cell wall biosynthesis
VQALAEFADCTVMVGPEHMPGIRRWEAEEGNPRIEFVEVADRWRTPPDRRHRLTRFLAYLLWLRHARGVGADLQKREPFDVVYHATYSTYWLPTPAAEYAVPCIWGPVGGAVVTPASLWPLLGWRGLFSEALDFVAVRMLSAFPATRRTCQRALIPIVQNEATRDRLPRSVQSRAIVLNHAMFTEVPPFHPAPRGRHCLFAGSLESRKGAGLAIRALAHAADAVHLYVVGDGPERRALDRLAQRLGVASRVTFLGRQPRSEVLRRASAAAAVVFTGLREEGGVTLAEAMLIGAPVIVLAHGGPRTIAASTIDPSRVALVDPADPTTTARRFGEAMTHFCREVATGSGPMLDVRGAKRQLRRAVEQVCWGEARYA